MRRSVMTRLKKLLLKQSRDTKLLIRTLETCLGITRAIDDCRARIAETGGTTDGAELSVSSSRLLEAYKRVLRHGALSGVARLELEPYQDGGWVWLEERDPIWVTCREFELLHHLAVIDLADDGFPHWLDLETLRHRILHDGEPISIHNLHNLIHRVRAKFLSEVINPFFLMTLEGRARVVAREIVLSGETSAGSCGPPVTSNLDRREDARA
jgi:hypothetical protein